MRIIPVKIIAHLLLSLFALCMTYFALALFSETSQYIFIGVIILVYLLTNTWVAVLPEHDYQGNS